MRIFQGTICVFIHEVEENKSKPVTEEKNNFVLNCKVLSPYFMNGLFYSKTL